MTIENITCEDCGQQPQLVQAGFNERPAVKCECDNPGGSERVIYISFWSDRPDEWLSVGDE